jgi:hypothetical protein
VQNLSQDGGEGTSETVEVMPALQADFERRLAQRCAPLVEALEYFATPGLVGCGFAQEALDAYRAAQGAGRGT